MRTSSARTLGTLLAVLDLGVEVEEGVEAHFELPFDLLAAAFEDVHGDARLVSVLQGDWGVTNLCYLVGGQQSPSVDQRQVCHAFDSIRTYRGPCPLPTEIL